MKNLKSTIEFSEDDSGTHYIKVTDDTRYDKISIDLNKLNINDIIALMNGLGNILTSLSAVMYKFKKIEKNND